MCQLRADRTEIRFFVSVVSSYRVSRRAEEDTVEVSKGKGRLTVAEIRFVSCLRR